MRLFVSGSAPLARDVTSAEAYDAYASACADEPFYVRADAIRLNARAINLHGAAKAGEHAPVVRDEVVSLGRLEQLRHLGKAGIPHDPAKGLRAKGSFADELVPIPPRSEWCLRVVEVQAAEQVESEDRQAREQEDQRCPGEGVHPRGGALVHHGGEHGGRARHRGRDGQHAPGQLRLDRAGARNSLLHRNIDRDC